MRCTTCDHSNDQDRFGNRVTVVIIAAVSGRLYKPVLPRIAEGRRAL